MPEKTVSVPDVGVLGLVGVVLVLLLLQPEPRQSVAIRSAEPINLI